MCFEIARAKPNAPRVADKQTTYEMHFPVRRVLKESRISTIQMLAVQNMTMRAFIPQGKRRFTHILLCSLQNNKSETRLVRLSSSSHHTECEDQLRRKILEKIIRVDHAGEMGASFIYQGTTKI